MKSTSARYVSLVLAVVGLLLVGMGLWLNFQHHLLVSDGVEVEATVTHKEAKGRPGQQVFTAQLVPADQPQLSIKVRMTEAQFAAANEGESILFSYVAGDPETHMIGSLDQARDLESRDQLSAIAGVLALAAAAAVYVYSGRPARRGKANGAQRGK